MASSVCQICQDDFSATCRLAPCLWDMLICSSQSISWPKCCNKTGVFERHPSIVAKTTGETELSSHAPPRPQKARLKMCSKLKLVREAKTRLLTTSKNDYYSGGKSDICKGCKRIIFGCHLSLLEKFVVQLQPGTSSWVQKDFTIAVMTRFYQVHPFPRFPCETHGVAKNTE